jgi:hypothetical protein
MTIYLRRFSGNGNGRGLGPIINVYLLLTGIAACVERNGPDDEDLRGVLIGSQPVEWF